MTSPIDPSVQADLDTVSLEELEAAANIFDNINKETK